MSPEDYYVVAEPHSPLRRTILQFLLVGGNAEERFQVYISMRIALGKKYLLRTFPDTAWERKVTSIWPSRSVREIVLPVRQFLPPHEGAFYDEAAAGSGPQRGGLEESAWSEGHDTLVRWARRS